MKGNITLKRISAYLIDWLVVLLIGTAITELTFINPLQKEYAQVREEYNDILEKYYNKAENIDTVSTKIADLSYEMNKTGYVYIISDMVVIILYFGVFASITKGQTLGKRLMNIRIIKKNDEVAKSYQYFIRCIFLNGVLMDIVILIAICFSKNTYYTIYNTASKINMAYMLILFLMIMFTNNGRGIHDLIAGTKVIDTKKTTVLEEKIEETKEEKEIKPKKEKKKKDE